MISEALLYFACCGAALLAFLGGRARRRIAKRLSAFGRDLSIVKDIASVRARQKYVRVKSEYYWFHRGCLPRMLRWVADRALRVDPTYAAVDCPAKPSDSLRINRVVVRGHSVHTELRGSLTERLRMLDEPGAADQVLFAASDLLPDKSPYSSEPCTVDVDYRGHSNPAKKIPAKNYFVRYHLDEGGVARFPPYGVREAQRKGFGVKKIKSAWTQGEKRHDMTRLAHVCAGPRYNFYSDVDDDAVASNFIDVDEGVLVTYAGSGKEPTDILLHPTK